MFNSWKRLLMFALILILSIPISFLAAVPSKAHAATPVATSVKKDLTAPKLYGVGGWTKDRAYNQGEKIDLRLSYGEKDLTIVAAINFLDPTFSQVTICNYLQDGTYRLLTPRLTSEMNEGSRQIILTATDSAGNMSKETLKVTLRRLEIPEITSIKINSQNQVTLNWLYSPESSSYIVEWQPVDGVVEGRKKLPGGYHYFQFALQKTGTNYLIKLSAESRQGEVNTQKINVISMGKTATEQVLGVETKPAPKEITPAIGRGVSTTSQVVQQPQKVAEVPKTAESPKPEEETQKSGWNRLLIALAILIIAAGAAIGGYYGYEWWQAKKDETEPPAPKSSSRW